MSIGLYDYDYMNYAPIPFNLEIMKMYSYYLKHNQIVVMINNLLRADKYGLIEVRKDYEDNKYPPEFTLPNIHIGGASISDKIYNPLDIDMEECVPTTSIYSKYKGLFVSNSSLDAAFDMMSSAQHARLSLNGTDPWNNYSSQFYNIEQRHTLFLHDKNLNDIAGSKEEIRGILSHMYRNHYLATKYPIVVDNVNDLRSWLSFPKAQAYFSIRYNNILSDEELLELARRHNKNSYKYVTYDITSKSFHQADFIENYIQKIFYQAMYCRQTRTPINFIYDSNKIKSPEIRNFIILLNMMIRGWIYHLSNNPQRYKLDLSAYGYCRTYKERESYRQLKLSFEEVKSIFFFFKENYNELYKELFYCDGVEITNGRFKPCLIPKSKNKLIEIIN